LFIDFEQGYQAVQTHARFIKQVGVKKNSMKITLSVCYQLLSTSCQKREIIRYASTDMSMLCGIGNVALTKGASQGTHPTRAFQVGLKTNTKFTFIEYIYECDHWRLTLAGY
jgi:hypothetical protein